MNPTTFRLIWRVKWLSEISLSHLRNSESNKNKRKLRWASWEKHVYKEKKTSKHIRVPFEILSLGYLFGIPLISLSAEVSLSEGSLSAEVSLSEEVFWSPVCGFHLLHHYHKLIHKKQLKKHFEYWYIVGFVRKLPEELEELEGLDSLESRKIITLNEIVGFLIFSNTHTSPIFKLLFFTKADQPEVRITCLLVLLKLKFTSQLLSSEIQRLTLLFPSRCSGVMKLAGIVCHNNVFSNKLIIRELVSI